MPESVEKLEIWQRGVALVEEIYAMTRSWPREEIYCLTGQLRRAAVSVPANLAEGIGRGTTREAARYAQIALGSLYELDTLFVIAGRLGYLNEDEGVRLRESVKRLCRQVSSFVAYQKGRDEGA